MAANMDLFQVCRIKIASSGEEEVVKCLLNKWDKRFTPTGSERALENYLARFPKRSPYSLSFLFSSTFLCPPALPQFHLLAYSSFSHPVPSHKTIALVSLLIYSPANEQQQSPLCRLRRLLFITSFSSQLRLGGSASALLPGDSHSKEQPWLSPLQLPSGKEGRACEGGERPLEGTKHAIPAAISHFEGHSGEAFPSACRLGAVTSITK